MYIHFSVVFGTERWRSMRQLPLNDNLSTLREKLPTFCLASRADNTRKNYKFAFNAWKKWCVFNSVSALPASDIHVSLYLIHLTESCKSSSKINEAFYAISWIHKLAGCKDPCESDLVVQVKEGATRIIGHSVTKKEPITPDTLKFIVLSYGNENSNLKDLRVACMCLLSFSGFLRFSELANLKRSNITFFDSYVKLFLEKSKTDVYREGRDVVISKTNTITCPVSMLSRYLNMANISPTSTEYIFRGVSYCKHSNNYKLRKSGKLSYTTAREILLSALQYIGLDKSKFGLHSLRSGGATAAAAAGIEDRIFKKHGRWKSDKAKDGYVKESLEERLSVTKNLGL